ncbi:MAG: DNA-deoxyinosine glycosylase [Clostridia bacterium]|nr:DNA-deoxyinosine glycosylase [Clostridia bacterium]
MTQLHNIAPVYDQNSRILILGSFPSVRSREVGFFYGHPQNRFWRTLAHVLGDEIPRTVEQKKVFLLSHGIALWDVIASCEITGSSDSSIKDAVPNDIGGILDAAPIERIFTNGATAYRLYCRYLQPVTGREAMCLPSTSPANAVWTQARLDEAWAVVGKRNAMPFIGEKERF